MSANGHLYYPGLLTPLSLATRNKIIWLVYSLKGLNKGKVMTRSTAQSIGEGLLLYCNSSSSAATIPIFPITQKCYRCVVHAFEG